MLARLRAIFVCLVVLFLLLPVLSVAVSSVSSSALFVFPPTGFTWRWYGAISPTYLSALRVSVIVAIGSTALALAVGVPAGLALVRGKLPFAQEVTAVFLSPLTVPSLIIGVAVFQFSPILWSSFGLPVAGTIAGLVLAHSTFTVPFVIRAVVAGQTQFDYSIEEAAISLGSPPLRVFFTVTLPVLSPAIVSGGNLRVPYVVRRCAGCPFRRRRGCHHLARIDLQRRPIQPVAGSHGALHRGLRGRPAADGRRKPPAGDRAVLRKFPHLATRGGSVPTPKLSVAIIDLLTPYHRVAADRGRA